MTNGPSLKHIPDWPAAKWEAMWEGAVMYRQLQELQQQCKELQGPTAAAAAVRPSGSQWAAAAAAAVKLYGQVTAVLEGYQRQESGFEQRMRAQGVPWRGQELVVGVKEAAVNLGTVYVTAVLAVVQEGQQKLLQQQPQQQQCGPQGPAGGLAGQLPGSSNLGGNLAGRKGPQLWGCPVKDPRQSEKLQKMQLRQEQQLRQRWAAAAGGCADFLVQAAPVCRRGFDEGPRAAFHQLAEVLQPPACCGCAGDSAWPTNEWWGKLPAQLAVMRQNQKS